MALIKPVEDKNVNSRAWLIYTSTFYVGLQGIEHGVSDLTLSVPAYPTYFPG
ncbi:uncharacterized protein BO97DRAFT_406430 [Aspergillus homomorphus CBS 101889]|uniref:Uncharacterized protein n=1 Tax=Aspergillus homomorphus (strain CBS 101889) TaxID=1450537 RepID=A0A395HUY2_ASPHC|nr:hypothetical protein BO97DRAFT_406430 [Aspergillus homomorphus CBS 101889]RAL11223.1 hypothetical protein BO97DRAFT_406430 [Aspergillus homomorphus CBS 101889]